MNRETRNSTTLKKPVIPLTFLIINTIKTTCKAYKLFSYLFNAEVKYTLHIFGSTDYESIVNPYAAKCCNTDGPGG